MIDLVAKIRRSILSPGVMVKEIWNYDYKDFNLIFEQSDVLHYFYVSAKTQRLISRIILVVLAVIIALILALSCYSATSAWRYNNLEASKQLIEQKRKEALSALGALSAGADEDKKTLSLSQEELIKSAHRIRERMYKMQALLEFSAQELRLANRALEQGLKASGVPASDLNRIKLAATPVAVAMGGDSEEIKFDSASDDALATYKLNLAQLEQLKQVFKLFPTESPIQQAITSSKFGIRVHPITNKLTAHTGLDYVPQHDFNAKTVLSGVVEKVQYSDIGYGNMVTVLHANKVRTIYAHLDKVNVVEKQKVYQGDVLGKIGNSGYSTGRHLHYEISIDNVKINPSMITAMAKNVQ